MAVIVGDAAVRLRPETGKFASDADSELSGKLPGVAKKAAGFFAVAFAAVKIGNFLGEAITQATDLGENVSKVGVVFGDQASIIEDFASTASTALGQSRNQALEAAGTFGTLFTGMGIGQKEAAGLSTDLVTLASDMASFGNATPQEALDALRSGLVGETEPLRRFGVMLSASAIEAEAVRLGLASTGEELSASAKAQATYSLAMKQTSVQHGDFARTSAGLANQQRIMRAQFTDLATNIGGLFVPVLANLAGFVTGTIMPVFLRWTENMGELGATLGAVGDIFGLAFTDGLGPALDAYSELEGVARIVAVIAANVGDLSAIFREAFVDGQAGAAMLADNGLMGIAAQAGVAAAAVRDSLGRAWEILTISLGPVLSGLQETFGAAFSTIGETIGAAFGGGGGGGIAAFGDVLASLVTGALPLIIDYFTRWAEVVQAVIPIIVTVLQALVPVIADVFAQIGPVLQQLAPIIGQVAGIFATTLVAVLQALAPVIPPLVEALGQVASVLAGALLSVITALAPVLPTIAEAFGAIAQVLAGALVTVLDALTPILPPLAEALGAIATALAGALAGALGAIIPLLPPLLDAFMQLVTAALVPLMPLLPLLAQLIAQIIAAVAPLIPPVLQLVMALVTLAIQAITPLLPIVITLIGWFLKIVGALMPIISVGLKVVAFFLDLRTKVVSAIAGLVSGAINLLLSLIGWFISLPGKILGAIGNLGSLLVDAGGDLIQGLVKGIGAAASFVGDIGKNVVNAIIGFINDQMIDRINNLLEFEIAGVSIDVPDIPHIPKLHEGGVFTDGGGEGLALLRDQELVATPEQRRIADDLLRGLLNGDVPTQGGAATAAAGGVSVTNNITQQPGESGEALAARVTSSVVWNLNTGATRRIGAGAASPA